MVETFLIHSLLELRYREARVTKADEIIEDRAAQFLKAPAADSVIWSRRHRGDGRTGGGAMRARGYISGRYLERCFR